MIESSFGTYAMIKKINKEDNLWKSSPHPIYDFIPNNSFLHKIKLKNTNLCTFCKIHNETIEHLFFDCPVTQSFLKLLSKQLKQYYKNLIFDKKEYFFVSSPGIFQKMI